MKDPKKCCCPKCEGRMRYNPICKHGDCPCHAPTIQESPDLPTNPTQISTKLVGESPTQGGGEWERRLNAVMFENKDAIGFDFGFTYDDIAALIRDLLTSHAAGWQRICSNARKEEAAHTRAEIAEKVEGMKIVAETPSMEDCGNHNGLGECCRNAALDAVLKELDKEGDPSDLRKLETAEKSLPSGQESTD